MGFFLKVPRRLGASCRLRVGGAADDVGAEVGTADAAGAGAEPGLSTDGMAGAGVSCEGGAAALGLVAVLVGESSMSPPTRAPMQVTVVTSTVSATRTRRGAGPRDAPGAGCEGPAPRRGNTLMEPGGRGVDAVVLRDDPRLGEGVRHAVPRG